MFIATLKQLFDLLSTAERRRAYLLFIMIFIMGLLDMTGIASIMPFLSVLANPDVIDTNPALRAAYETLGFTDKNSFLYFVGVAVFVILIVSIVFKAATHYSIYRFTHMRGYSISQRLVSGYLKQPYEWFLSRNSADLAKTVLSEVEQVIFSAMIPAMMLIAYAATALALVILLLVVNPWLSIIMTALLGGAYALTYIFLRKYLLRIGSDRLQANEARFMTVQESFGGIKDVKIGGHEDAFMRRFEQPAQRYARNLATSKIASYIPRYVIEGVGFGGMFLLVLSLMGDAGSLAQALPLIGLYGLAGFRLLPALQAVYLNLSTLRFAKPSLDALHADIQMISNTADQTPEKQIAQPLVLRDGLTLNDVTFHYAGTAQPSLAGLSLKIGANTTVGIVGGSGAGKTTAIDIILGLLWPTSGQLRVDDTVIDARNVRAWQRSIGYVPQQIFLSDASLAANIAFGIPKDLIDMAAVEEAARTANLHDYIVSDLPDGYHTKVGERGVRLSGGQRQRIGIARALYHDPELLIFDEATSALDNLTEKAVMDAVNNLAHRKTIIIIAHRLSTVRACDNIFLLEHGRLEAQGSYDELLDTNDHFRSMAQQI